MELRWYQEQAKAAAWDFLRNREGNPALVLPTGAGKSPLMAAMAQDAVQSWQGRVAILAHTQELVAQNADKLRRMWPQAPMGIYAAGLKRRDRFDPIIFAQIQSVAAKAHTLGRFDLLLIDEAHRIPLNGEGRYRQFIDDCMRHNPSLRVVGVTATPYRLQGRAVPVCGPDHILTEIAYEARIPDLIAEGFLSRLVSKAGEAPDLSAVHTRGGEYIEGELAALMSEDSLVDRTVADLLSRAVSRVAGIVFCVNVEHAEKVLARLHAAGESAALVHGGTPKGERTNLIAAFQAGGLRWMVNVNVLSEGFDAPHIDCVAMLRPTKSPGLYYQQVGRGLRLAPGKTDCLVLDYAMNVVEHGAIDEIRVQRARPGKEAQVQTGRTKECPQCSTLLALGIRACPECGHAFGGSDPAHLDRPVDAPVLSTERERVVNEFDVGSVKYERHQKAGKPVSMVVTYQCGMQRFREWVCLEHTGYARTKAVAWWRVRAGSEAIVPRTVNEALELAYSLARPSRIRVDQTLKYAEIVGYDFERQALQPVMARHAEADTNGAPTWLRESLRSAA